MALTMNVNTPTNPLDLLANLASASDEVNVSVSALSPKTTATSTIIQPNMKRLDELLATATPSISKCRLLGKKTSVNLLDPVVSASPCSSSVASDDTDTDDDMDTDNEAANVSASSASDEEDIVMPSPMEYLEQLFARHGLRLSGRRSSNHQRQQLRRPCPTEVDSYDMETTRAVRTMDLKKLRELHDKGSSLDASNKHGESLLHICCRRGAAKLVKFMLLEAKVNPRVMDDMGRTAFHDVLWSSTPNFDTLDILLQCLPPVGLLIQDVRGHTPFDYAPRKHWGVWLDYLQAREGAFVRWITSRKQVAAAAKMRQQALTQQQHRVHRQTMVPAADQQQDKHSSASVSMPTVIPPSCASSE